MSPDDVLFGIIVSGVGLSAAYFRDEYIRWRELRAAEMRKQASRRDLHIGGGSHGDSIRSVVTLEAIADTDSGGTGGSVEKFRD